MDSKGKINPNYVFYTLIIVVLIVLSINVYSIKSEIDGKSDLVKSIQMISKSTYVLLSTPTIGPDGKYAADVFVDENGVSWAKGTAFAVREDGWLLTAYHTISGAKGAVIVEFDKNGQQESTQIVQVVADPNNDFALIRVDKKLFPLKIIDSNIPVEAGTEIGFLGYPKGESTLFSHNGIISRAYFEGNGLRYNINAFVNEGQSGGPVFLSSTGELIGIISAREKASNLPQMQLTDTNAAGDNELMKTLLELKKGQEQIYNVLSDEIGRSSQMGVGVVIGINKQSINDQIKQFN